MHEKSEISASTVVHATESKTLSENFLLNISSLSRNKEVPQQLQ